MELYQLSAGPPTGLRLATPPTMPGDPRDATVLVVDDEAAYLDAFTTWLEDNYQVRSANNGEQALELLDGDVDVVLLDRLMPGLSGDEVLTEIRNRNVNCRVAMITAVEPEIDIIELDFDEYLIKPVSGKELRSVVEGLLLRSNLDDSVQECFALAAKKSALEASLSSTKLESQPEYITLQERLKAAEDRVNEALDALLDEGQVAAAYYDL